jgi:hypothetical protein
VGVLSRRSFLRTCSTAVLAVPVAIVLDGGAAAAAPGLPGVTVRPRSDWAQGLASGPMEQERPEDVRFLIVHHTASPNGYAAGDVPSQLRGFHGFHTGPDKGWPDVAYNFFVDRYGTVWEGRAGSLAGPVKPDATGGSQGFSQICCFVGDHTTEPPTPEARRYMTQLLAGLAERYGIDPSGTTSFVSRGSNKWPAGADVTTSAIAGHRDMSQTTCPGDAAYPLVKQALPADVAAVLAARATPTPAPTSSAPAPSTPAPESTAATSAAATSAASPSHSPEGGVAAADDDGVEASTVALVAGGAVATGAAAVLVHRLRRRSAPVESQPGTGDG